MSSESKAKELIQALRDKHSKAVHVCSAWRIGTTGIIERSSDDGEPSNSAGKPILGQLVKYGLTNTLIGVVRYYGGVNLGVGGLITAYKTAAEESILNGQIIEKFKEIDFIIYFNPADTGDAMALLNRGNVNINEHSMNEKGSFVNCSTLLSKFEDIKSVLNQSGKFTIEITP